MLYIGYLIGMDGSNVKKTVSEISIFELHRLENCNSRLCPNPLGTPPHTKKHPNRAKNAQVQNMLYIGYSIIVNGQNIKNKLKNFHFCLAEGGKLPKQAVPQPSWEPSPQKKRQHPNGMRNTWIGSKTCFTSDICSFWMVRL